MEDPRNKGGLELNKDLFSIEGYKLISLILDQKAMVKVSIYAKLLPMEFVLSLESYNEYSSNFHRYWYILMGEYLEFS